MKYNEYIVIQL